MLEIVFFYVLCFTRPRYQVSVYRTIGPLVLGCYSGGQRTSQSRDFGNIGHTHLVTKTPSSGKKINLYAKLTIHS